MISRPRDIKSEVTWSGDDGYVMKCKILDVDFADVYFAVSSVGPRVVGSMGWGWWCSDWKR